VKNKIYIIVIVLTATLFVLFQSCKKTPKNTQTDYNKEMITIKDAQYLQQFSNQFMLTFFKSIYDSTLINTGHSKIDSAIASLTNGNDSLKISIEYWSPPQPTWHHIDSYRHYRTGRFVFEADSLFLENNIGDVNILVIKPFYFDSLPVNISNIHISKTGLSNEGNQTFKAIFDAIVMDGNYADKFTYQFNATFNYELFKDPSTPYASKNDYFLLSGNIGGNIVSGINYQTQIDPDTSRYKIDFQCHYTIEGKSIITLESDEAPVNQAVLNYVSSDGCANYFEIIFPEKFSTKSLIE